MAVSETVGGSQVIDELEDCTRPFKGVGNVSTVIAIINGRIVRPTTTKDSRANRTTLKGYRVRCFFETEMANSLHGLV